MNKNEYFKLYKDPRWQKKRLEILERDEWCCQICFDPENTLHVHHRYYIKDKKPWEYENDTLVTLCEECHENESKYIKNSATLVLRSLKKKFFSDDLERLSKAFDDLNSSYPPEVTATIIEWVLSDENIFHEMEDRFWDEECKEFFKKRYNRG
jgi:hypothetical protein